VSEPHDAGVSQERARSRREGTAATPNLPSAVPVEEKPTVRLLRRELGDALLEMSDTHGDLAIQIRPDSLLQAARFCRDHDELSYDYLMDIAAVDYLGQDLRFELVYILYSLRHHHRVRLRVRLPEDEPTVDSLIDVWRGADWFEREVWDMMGIRFHGHPNLTRILTHNEFVGHALRKDYHPAERHRLSRTYDLFTESSAGAPPPD
jgi:NADH/F420H2 dehydrogenase subunit C